MRRIAVAVTAFALSSSAAMAAEVETPDGRVKLEVEAGPSNGGLSVRQGGNLGAYGSTNTLEAGPNGLWLTNPPTSGALELSPNGFVIRGDESPYGPPIAHATLGTGGITEAVGLDGRTTGLGWPGPGMTDHVRYLNVSRGHPNAGAPENAGTFGGIGSRWLTPTFGWRTVSQSWASSFSQTLVTVLANDELRATVTITDVVDPAEDLVARNFRFDGATGPFAYYANLNPTTSRVPRVPSVTDGVADHAADFATTYDAERSLMLHFRPYRADVTPLTMIATSHEGAALARDAVRGTFGPGVYIAVAGQSSAPGHQAGLEPAGLIRAEGESTPLIDPYYDLADGELSGSDAAVGKTAGGLGGIPADADGSFTVYIAAADGAKGAGEIVARARARGFAEIRRASEDFWAAWITRARLPATADERTRAVARHALMLIRTAMDRRTGAIVANATVQTPYRQDWVRDGAFFNYALLLAGYPELAKEHAEFYRRVYRPGGTWDSFYYPDGAEAGAFFPYEIDSQAFALWALWLPAAFESDVAERTRYLSRVYAAIAATADALLLCRDPITKLQCYAAEDDAVQPTQGAQGAATVYLGLRSAIAAAHALGVAPNPGWAARSAELRAAALKRLCNTEGCRGGRGGVYLVWPSRLLDQTSALRQAHLEQFVAELDANASFASPPIGGYLQYPMEPLLALGTSWTATGRGAKLDAWVRWLTHDLAEPGVLHFGERIFRSGERTYLHSIGFPHIWSGAETYIGAVFAYGLSDCPDGVARVGDAVCH
jgi:hypothetical protein